MDHSDFANMLVDLYKELYILSHNKFQMTIRPKNIPHFSEKLELLEMSITLMYHEFDRNKCISIFKILNEYKNKAASYWKKVSQINEAAILNLVKLSKNNKEKKKYENLYLSILKNNELIIKEGFNVNHKNHILYISTKISENI